MPHCTQPESSFSFLFVCQKLNASLIFFEDIAMGTVIQFCWWRVIALQKIFNTQVVSLRILQQFQHEWLFLPIERNTICFLLSWMSVCIPKNPITNHLIQLHLRIVQSDWLRAFPDIIVE